MSKSLIKFKEIPFERSFASCNRANNWSKQNDITPRQVYRATSKKYKFDCDNKKCGHTFDASIYNVVSGSFCPYCTNKKLCDDINCKPCHKKSVASHLKSIMWSKKNNISPRNVFKSSHKKYIFDCDDCNHQIETSPDKIVANHFCAYCANQKLCDDNKCDFCKNHSFVSHPKSKFWSLENDISPRQIFKNTHKVYKFNCDVCKHQFETSPHNVVAGQFCPYCSIPPQKMCYDTKCKFCNDKSFALHPMAIFWSKKNKSIPRHVFKFSNKKFKFDCPHCDEVYETMLCLVSIGHWCSCIKNKTEIILYKFLKSKYDTEKQKKFDWCKNINHLPFDFCIENLKLIIELDGGQHFKQVSNWKSPEKIQEIDLYKMKMANEHGYSVIRLFQEDVWNNKNNWRKILKKIIKKYDKPKNIYFGSIYLMYPIHNDSNKNQKFIISHDY